MPLATNRTEISICAAEGEKDEGTTHFWFYALPIGDMTDGYALVSINQHSVLTALPSAVIARLVLSRIRLGRSSASDALQELSTTHWARRVSASALCVGKELALGRNLVLVIRVDREHIKNRPGPTIAISALHELSRTCLAELAFQIAILIRRGALVSSTCRLGQYQDREGSLGCNSCLPGTFGDTVGATSIVQCKKCPRGTSSFEGSSSCRPCNKGTFADAEGLPFRKNCAAGTVGEDTGLDAADKCKVCPKGTYSFDGASSCIECRSGQYQDTAESSSCKNCPKGTFSVTQRATDISTCQPCPKGMFNRFNGESSCRNWGRGSFQEQTGAQFCEQGPDNTFSTVVKETSQSVCTKCPAWATNDTGSTVCS